MKKKIQNGRVVEMMIEAKETFEERNATYRGTNSFGGAYKQHGHVVQSFFPDGIELSGPDDHSRFAILDMIIGKLIRYSNNFHNGGHDDSLKDISVYANMLRELDEIANAQEVE